MSRYVYWVNCENKEVTAFREIGTGYNLKKRNMFCQTDHVGFFKPQRRFVVVVSCVYILRLIRIENFVSTAHLNFGAKYSEHTLFVAYILLDLRNAKIFSKSVFWLM